MKKHFVFDFDDTLSSSYDFNQEMFVRTFLPYQPDIDQQYLRTLHKSTRGKAMHLIFEEAIKHFDLKLDPHKLVKENDEMHLANFDKMTLFSNIHEMFEKLISKGKTISICTNRQYLSLNAMLDHHNLRQYLKHIVSCKDEGYEKPNPKCLLDIIELEGGVKDEFIYFGDSTVDYEFASSAGIDFVIVDHYLNERNFYKMIVSAFLD